MSSAFDPATFLDASISEPTTARPPLAPGDYLATISDLKAGSWQGKQDPSKSGAKFDVHLKVQVTDPAQQAVIGGSELIMFDTIMLDTTPSGGIDNSPGKNSKLRRYREALDMNQAGVSFVPRQMIGRTLKVRVAHEPYQGEMKDKIDAVARA